MPEQDPTVEPFVPSRIPEERPGPEGGRRHANRLARTKSLCEAAVGCFLEQGLDAVTIDEIARAAEVSKGSFYRYFKNKEELVDSVFLPLSGEIRAAMTAAAESLEEAHSEGELVAAYQTLAKRLLQLFLSHPSLVRLFLQERHGPTTPARVSILTLDAQVVELAVRITHAGQGSGMVRKLDPRVSATVVLGAAHELLWRHFLGTGPEDPTAAALQFVDLILHGVRLPSAS